MAAAHGTTTHLPAGPMATSVPIKPDEVQEYERILKISDEIFSGSHPRLKVPQHLVRKPGTRNGQNGISPQQGAQPKSTRGISESVRPPQTTRSPKTAGSVPSASATNAPFPSTRLASKPSEIDPIFLTKSDDLVRAELQLQRQRVERVLRDQLEQKKQDLKHKNTVHDTRPEFNVSEVLNKALEIVRPVSLSDPSETNGPSDSFDDNSFYSSRAPDSPAPAGAHRKSSPVAPAQPAGASAHAPVDHYSDELQRLEALNRTGSDQEMQDAYSVADQRIPYYQKQPLSGQTEATHRLHESQQAENVEEPEYSPPAPVAPPIDNRGYEPGPVNGGGRGPYVDRNRAVQVFTSPTSNVRVVQNHITSPAAPRPSRVSPLAVAKIPSVQQIRDERSDHESPRVYSDPDSRRGSPSGQAPHLMPRKRRRLQERGDNARQVSYRRQNADPADAFIKEEPVSPPPFADDPALVRSRQPQERPVYIDIASPQYSPVVERGEPSARAPVYEVDPYPEMPIEQVPPRTVSRLSTRRPVRDDTDLRRVASMQYARQAEYPREYIETDPRATRAASYAVVERRIPEQPRYYEEIPSYGPRYIAVDDMHQPFYRGPYYEEIPAPRVMAAPQRRIVVDEHGTQYYEVIPAPRLQPMAPPPRPMSRAPAPKPDAYDDRTPVRTASVRAPSVIQDSYDRRYVHEMPPPQPIYRRIPADYARPVAGDRRTYATPLEGHEPYPHDGSVQIAEYLPRRPPYAEEHALPPERVIRTASVRPPQARYEGPPEVVHRVGSVRPGGPSRDVSVYMDERPMGDYIERPYYVRERRYYEGDDGNRMVLDGASEPVQRVSQRY
ncbi:uncharacterized protein N7459_004186 [Penicillium hispanicum]|uniref:uncharacterized protein n=1 Tax=Penicillium hispanicum TaxID=1080232 RepID=UPI002541E9EE|nr:uncharacterized protein N7459_004186 [Penicillium hispanicum]KAJ5584386.1 hypothetical protein N7459_004186 [Penicillium hispanicum]